MPTYVEHGVADAGIVGADVLSESRPDVFEPLDLGIGACRMVVARPESRPAGFYRDLSVVRVATKYPMVTTRFFHGRGIPVEVIPLAGSVELAPIVGLSDAIVDLVESGATLRENGLVEVETIFDVSSVLVANRSLFKLRHAEIQPLVEKLRVAVGG